jgi:hypothetical protein
VIHRQSGEAYEYLSLNIREKPTGEVYVEDLSLIPVTNPQEVCCVGGLTAPAATPRADNWQVFSIIAAGFAQRQTYETLMNPVSSRSHTLFTLIIRQTGWSLDRWVLNVL